MFWNWIRKHCKRNYSSTAVTLAVGDIVQIMGQKNDIPAEFDVRMPTYGSAYIFEADALFITVVQNSSHEPKCAHVFYRHRGAWLEVFRKPANEEVYIFRYGAWVDQVMGLAHDARHKRNKTVAKEHALRYGPLEE